MRREESEERREDVDMRECEKRGERREERGERM